MGQARRFLVRSRPEGGKIKIQIYYTTRGVCDDIVTVDRREKLLR